jgi:hypothetical protein
VAFALYSQGKQVGPVAPIFLYNEAYAKCGEI